MTEKENEEGETSPFKISKGWLSFVSWAAIVTSGIFILFILLQLPVITAILAGWCVVIILYFVARKRFIIKSGTDFNTLFSTMPGYEED